MKVAILGDGHDSSSLKDKIHQLGGFCQMIPNPLRVYKKFCFNNEMIEPSRFVDLFRVVYEKNDLEYFEDFDVIVDALNPVANGMGANGIDIVGEIKLKSDSRIFYQKISDSIGELIILIGQDYLAQKFLDQFKEIIIKENKKIIWVLNGLDQKLEIDLLKKEFVEDFEKKKSNFVDSINSWKKLEDYEKAKVPKPKEPQSLLRVFESHQASAIDCLSDREQLYLTIEAPEWRNSNEFYEIFPADQVFVFNSFKPQMDKYSFLKNPDNSGLNDLEKGFLTLYPCAWNSKIDQKGDIDQIICILKSYFSPNPL